MPTKPGVRARTPRRAAVRAAAIALLGAALCGPLLTATAATTPEPVKKNSAKASVSCAGVLSWFAVNSCDRIAAGETDTYTVTTSKAGEVVLGRVGIADEMRVDVTLTGPGTSCFIVPGFEPDGCKTGAPGTYTLTVVGQGQPGPYTVSIGSTAAPGCSELTAADLSPKAAAHPGVLASGKVADCYQLPGTSGDVIRVGEGTGIVRLYDAAGAEVCRVASTPSSCEPEGPGPFRAFVTQGDDSAGSYTLRLIRLNNPIGCAALPLAPFGSQAGAVGTGLLKPWETDCQVIAATAGLYEFKATPVDRAVSVSYDVLDSAGRLACRDVIRGACQLTAGSYTLLLENRNYDDQLTYQIAAFPLGDSRGCAPEVGTSWDLPVLAKTQTSELQVDCQPIRAVAGERLLVRSPGPGSTNVARTRVVDKDGGLACPRVFGVAGCVLEGTAPYRVLSDLGQVATPTDYQLDIGRLSNPVGCTPVGFSTFGVAPTAPAGSRCRQLAVPSPGTYVVDAGANQDWNELYGLYGTDGLVGCSAMLRCTLSKSGSYALIAPVGEAVSTFALTATNGCVAQPADTFAAQTGSLADKQYDCLTLSSPVGANVMGTVPANQGNIAGTVVDAVGHEMCSWGNPRSDPCKLAGTPPFRALVHPLTAGAYRLSVPRVDGSGCPVLPQGDFTTPGGVTAALSPGRFVACYSMPAGSHSSAELMQFARTGSVGNAALKIINAAGDETCHVDTDTDAFDVCGFGQGQAYSAVLVGDAATASFRVMRRDVTSTAKGCAGITSSTIGATAGTGTLADNSVLRCHRFNAAATDRFMINTRDARGSVRAIAFGPGGEWVCETVLEGRCDASGHTSYQVVVWNDKTFGAPGPYTLETPRTVTAGAPAPECARVSSAYGVGPFNGELTTAKNTTCTVFNVGKYETIGGTAANQVANGPSPYMIPSWGGYPTCRSAGEGFECVNSTGGTQTQMLLLSLPERQPSPLKYKLSTTCEHPLCGGTVFAVTSVAPKTGVAGTTVNVTIKGAALHPRDVVRLTLAGKPAITGTMRSVTQDRTTSVYAFNLTGAAAGVRDLYVTSFAGASATLARAFTVTAK